MYQTIELLPGVTLRTIRVHRFKQGCMSLQLLRPMCREEAALNALVSAVLLRGCREYPDMRRITQRLDDLYGASIGTSVRRIGDSQTTGFYCNFMEDRFALPGDRILEPMLRFVGQLLLEPVTGNGIFDREFVESEKRNLISVLESERSDKRAYSIASLLQLMCREDPFGIPRLGQIELVEKVTPEDLWQHYRKILRESPVELFYVGSAEPETVARIWKEILCGIDRDPRPMQRTNPLAPCSGQDRTEVQQIAQSKLALGYVTPITQWDPRFPAMHLCNLILGGGMTSKLFMQVREKESLCYAIGSAYYGSKGIVTVHAGVDGSREQALREGIQRQLQACRDGQITPEELEAAREEVLSALRAVYDSPGAMENHFSVCAIQGLDRSPEVFSRQIRGVTLEDVVQAARTLQPHSSFFLKGEQHG